MNELQTLPSDAPVWRQRLGAVLSGLPKRYLKEVPRRRIRLLVGLGEAALARRIATEAAARFPNDEGFALAARSG